MSRLSIELDPEQHRAIKARAALEGLNIKDFVLDKIFSPSRAKKAIVKARAKAGAKVDACPLCAAYGGKNKPFNKRTQQTLLQPGSKKTIKKYDSVDAMFRDLGIR